MKIPTFKKIHIEESEREALESDISLNNIHRGRIMAVITTGIETLLLLIAIITALLNVDDRFSFNTYMFMYSVMIIINLIYLLYTKGYNKIRSLAGRQQRQADGIVLTFASLTMLWGSIISLMDQRLYGHVMAFMINLMVCGIIFVFDRRKILIPYSLSTIVLAVGLPFFQHSKDVLIGHYVNGFVFIIVSWIASRIIYHNFCESFISKRHLNESNVLLEKQIEENKAINHRLAIANIQLKRLAMLDELTGIQNRRSFREFIEMAFQHYVYANSTISVIMIDIDLFKQFNDKYGHEEGDKILVAVANQLNAVISSPSEIVVRWGGEEFIYAAFNKPPESVFETAEIINQNIKDLQLKHEDCPYGIVTVSMGTCTVPINVKEDTSNAIDLADRALYLAKSCGRNCIKTSDDLDTGHLKYHTKLNRIERYSESC